MMGGSVPARAAFGVGLLLLAGSQLAGLGWAVRHEGSLPGLIQDPFHDSRAAFERGDAAGAARELRAAAAIHRYNLDLLLKIVEAQARAGDRTGGRQTLDRAERLAPGKPKLLAGLGWILISEKRWAEAERALREAAAALPHDAWVLSSLGELLLEQDHYAEAAEVFSQSVALDPDQMSVRASLGIAYALSGRPERAVAEFTAVVRVDPSPRMIANLRRAEAAVRDARSSPKAKVQ